MLKVFQKDILEDILGIRSVFQIHKTDAPNRIGVLSILFSRLA